MKVLIIGASRGIGLEFCRQFKNKKYEVMATCRSVNSELQALGIELIEGIDVKELPSLKHLTTKIAKNSIDMLIYNSGIFKNESVDDLNLKTIEEQFHVNTLGAVASVKALLHAVKDGGKIGLMSSLVGSLEDNTSGAYYGYRMSKAALNAFGKSLSHDLIPRKISVCLLHPGYVKTDMTSHQGHIEPRESVSGLIKVMEGLTLKTTGSFKRYDGGALPW